MRQRPDDGNVGVRHGAWGEAVAVRHLRRAGFVIVDRNARPVERDGRLEIDIVAWDRKADVMAFVEVKQHAEISPYARRLQSVDRRKKLNLRRACRAGGGSTGGTAPIALTSSKSTERPKAASRS